VATEEDAADLERMLENAREKGWEDTVQRMIDGDSTPGEISSGMNMYQGMLRSSRSQSENHPRLLMYDHSPGFQAYESGMAKVTGRRPEEEITDLRQKPRIYEKDNDAKTDYIPFEVLPEEAMPVNAGYNGSELPEVVLEHGAVDMQEDRQVTFQVHPYDPEDITGESWRQNLQDYERGDLQFARSSGS
jgi:hypothetical protein